LDKWEKIENLLNSLVEKIFMLISLKTKDLTPQKVKSKVKASKDLITNRQGLLKEKVRKSKDKAVETALSAKKTADVLKVRTAEGIIKAKEADIKNLSFAKIAVVLAAAFTPAFVKFKAWYIHLKPTQIVSFVGLSTVATLASVNIYVQSNKISEESRSPASELVEEVDRATAISRRPAYFKSFEKQFKVSNIVLPAYAQKSGPLKKLVIDFTFESSNKYIKEYLWRNPHLVQDVLNSKVEPLSVDFPLKDEGKVIIKEKIRRELNKKLNELKIKGEIKAIYIDSMIAG